MDEIINDTISDSEIAKLSKAYEDAKSSANKNQENLSAFQYAAGLLKSRHTTDIKHGINLLENLYYNGDQSSRRDYLYYIAIGHTRLKQYNLALDCVDHFLHYEPENRQAKLLKSFIKEKLTKDGLVGMALTGGAALVLGGLIGLGLSLAKK